MTHKLLLRVTLCGFLSGWGMMNAMETKTPSPSGFSAVLCNENDADGAVISHVKGFVSNLTSHKKNVNLSLTKEGQKHKLPLSLSNIMHLHSVAAGANAENPLVRITHGKDDKQTQHIVNASALTTAAKSGLQHAKPVNNLISAHSAQTKSELKNKIAGLAVAVKNDAKAVEADLADDAKKEEAKVEDIVKPVATAWFDMNAIRAAAQTHKPKLIGGGVVAAFMTLLGILQKYGHIDLSKLSGSKA